ncbi:hypothetical protein ASPZODRAFT_144619 [Penicilliopsis zonata CBS 506.65]|uniref:Carboxylic ester hydrolase n=1 Tax=Penicilliopsis zonata CBS 506.65 TaxID=1073090 RepID=A0A1L9SC04_9EURO|nr:hypothetical protein ASPZODRAFT_144619 [Penicilliopsis zonata CBS 506.65]OJJ44658.1 hypothetical protein ASPZODRAFT_144619 [Penicilliopsis zonata CBS 506.65]
MSTCRHPHVLSLSHRGYIQGATISSKQTGTPLCHFYGGVRYALAPASRWRRAHALPSTFTYGTKDQPGLCEEGASVCPQPGFRGPADESRWNEDCFQCNVWVPIGEPPKEGWPVFVFIHGGWLQFGTPNTVSVSSLLGETEFKCVMVMPAYRLNVFGFLYSAEVQDDASAAGETVGNFGFWDQRLALEWIKENISLFGGNPDNVTLAGYSAGMKTKIIRWGIADIQTGAYSVFYQIAYEVRLPESQAIIKQACIWSNGPGMQPKSLPETQKQFDQLVSALEIPVHLTPTEKMAQLRSIPAKKLLAAAASIPLHQFRPATDSCFVSRGLFATLNSGEFGRALAARNIRLLLGECRDEHALYALWFPPRADSLPALRERLLADYPAENVDKLIPLYYPDNRLPPLCADWRSQGFGRIYADMQVHTVQRGLVASLARAGASHLLHRYRIEYRLRCVDEVYPPEYGVTHSTDQYIWFWGNGFSISEQEKKTISEALIGPLVRFVRGEDIRATWGTSGHRQLRRLRSDGRVDIWEDELWEDAMRVWTALSSVRPRL